MLRNSSSLAARMAPATRPNRRVVMQRLRAAEEPSSTTSATETPVAPESAASSSPQQVNTRPVLDDEHMDSAPRLDSAMTPICSLKFLPVVLVQLVLC
jgi:hypothetical protein